MKCRVGIDIGATKVNIGILEEGRKVVTKRQISIRKGAFRPAAEEIAACLDTLLKASAIEYSKVESCGVGIPGTIDASGRVAMRVPNLGWINEPAADIFEELTGISTWLLQDSRAAAFGEYMLGAGSEHRICVCITLGTGIGTGIVIDGKIFDGALGCAGEIGHVPAVKGGRQCGCGRRGCLECYAAGKGLDISACELFGDGVTARTLFDKAKAGDTKAENIIREALEMLGKEMVSIVNLLSPDCLLFSGGLIHQEELFLRPLIDFIEASCYRIADGPQVNITVGQLGSDSPMIGAALFPATKELP